MSGAEASGAASGAAPSAGPGAGAEPSISESPSNLPAAAGGRTVEPHHISVVVPVYQGEQTLPALLAELAEYSVLHRTPEGHDYLVDEVLLVNDCGPDRSDRVIRSLAETYAFVHPIWLSRNFGQHAATLAGMASSGGDWIVTMDEDGQHDPADIGGMLDTAMREQASVVYAQPMNAAPHGVARNFSSKAAKWMISRVFAGPDTPNYQSFRLVVGNIGRSVAAYAGSGVYLDVALGWVADREAVSPVRLRAEGDRRSGYTPYRLFSHFWRMVLSSGTAPLRLVSTVGALFALIGIVWAIVILVQRVTGYDVPEGWASTVVIVLVSSGLILFFLGVIAEYIGVIVHMALGKPPYLITTDPARGPLGRGGIGQTQPPE